jgi:hypothetical protein
MSIFKSTFKPYVVRQINTRQNLLSEVNRPVDFAHYVSSKASWARMTSLVNYGPVNEEGPELAKKYILMGGTLYNRPGTDRYFDRRGVGGRGASYGGDLGTNQYGIRPMPGITSLKTRSLGAYGSLTEATVKFYAWDVKQLEDLTVLFMRPGYKVVLEWGWSMYLDTSVSGENYREKITTNALKYSASSYNTKTMVFNTIDCFDSGITQDGIYNQLDVLRHKYSGNYDGVLGSIMNFSYTLMPNGAYECTTVLISIGDTIDTIRMNDTVGISVGPRDIVKVDNPNIDEQSLDTIDYSEIKSQFELLMDEYCTLSDDNPRSNSENILAIDSVIKDADKPYIDTFIYKYKSGFSTSAANTLLSGDQALRAGFQNSIIASQNLYGGQKPAAPSNGSSLGTGVPNVNKDAEQAFPVSQDNPGDKRSYYYIQFSYFLHILNVFKNVFASKGQTLVDIEIPANPIKTDSISNGLCQASYNSISIDPNVAIIRNSRANLFTDIEGNKSFRPEIFKTETKAVFGPATVDNNLREYLYDNTNFGQIGNIYINIKEIVSIYKQESMSNRGYVYLGKVINEVLSRAAFSLGSINDFDKFVKNNKIVIIDKHYTELPEDSTYNSKFKINVSGNNSIVRSHKIESKIFPSQATMIAIAAQDRENVAAIQTSTYNYLNRGLKDRLFNETSNTKKDILENRSELAAKRKKLESILLLMQYVNNYVIVNKSIGVYYNSNIVAMNGYLNTLLVEMEGGTDYKAVVPISVNLTIDGLSGLTIGEIFTVDKKVLPRDYESKHIGFIVTGITNDIATNGWTTELSSQMCILDQEEKQKISKIKGEEVLKDILEEAENKKIENRTAIIYFNILAALVMDCLLNRYQIGTNDGVIKIRNTSNPLYTKVAITEFSGGLVDFDYVLKDLNSAYLKAFPTPQYDVNRKANFRIDNLNNPAVLTKVISEMSIYFALSTASQDVGIAYNNEYSKIMKGYIDYIIPGTKADFFHPTATWGQTVEQTFRPISNILGALAQIPDVVQGEKNPFSITIKPEDVKNNPDIQFINAASTATTFSKIDINKAVDVNTGLLNGPIKSFFISGYKYYKTPGSNANQDQ